MGRPKPGSAAFGGAERLEDPIANVGSDSRTPVPHFDVTAITPNDGRDFHRAVAGGLTRIQQQIQEHRTRQLTIRKDDSVDTGHRHFRLKLRAGRPRARDSIRDDSPQFHKGNHPSHGSSIPRARHVPCAIVL
jgi:hypothetical protein